MRVKDYFEDTNHIVLVLDHMMADFRTILMDLSAKLKEDQVKRIFHQMLESVHICHQNGIVHRDIKMENFLVEVPEGE